MSGALFRGQGDGLLLARLVRPLDERFRGSSDLRVLTAADQRVLSEQVTRIVFEAAVGPSIMSLAAGELGGRTAAEVAVVRLETVPGTTPADARRLVTLLHRAVPNPVLVVRSQRNGSLLSLAVAEKELALGSTVVRREWEAQRPDAAPRGWWYLDALETADVPGVYRRWTRRVAVVAACEAAGAAPEHVPPGDHERVLAWCDLVVAATAEMQRAATRARRATRASERVTANREAVVVRGRVRELPQSGG